MKSGARKLLSMLLTSFAATACLAGIDAVAAYPDKSIRLIVPFPAGGPTDAMARILGENLTKELGQTVIVENRGGAGGVIATEAAAASKPDGYTVFFATAGTMTINPTIYPEMRVKPQDAFIPVGMVATTENVLVVSPSLGVQSLKELIELAKTKADSLTYGSAGIGSSNHLSGALLADMAQINMLHVPYKGSAAALTDLLGGRISMMFDTISNATPNIKAGKVKALGVTGTSRTDVLADVPTIAEAGLPGFEVRIWFGIAVPKSTPTDVVDKLNRALNHILAKSDVKEKLASFGATPVGGTSDQFARRIKVDEAKWSALIKSTDTKSQ